MTYKLIYINKVGFDYKGQGSYEFLFCDDTTDLDEVWGEGWTNVPAWGMTQPPDEECVAKAGKLLLKEYELDVAHDHQFHSMADAKDGVIALGWEQVDEDFARGKLRLVFQYGETLDSVEAKINKRNLKLIYEDQAN